MELVRPKRRSPIPARQRPARAANAPPELGPRPRAKAARAAAAWSSTALPDESPAAPGKIWDDAPDSDPLGAEKTR
jgi:hypothetical protein